jgi:hypothetical protein
MNPEMSNIIQPKNACIKCEKLCFNDGGVCVKCLSKPVEVKPKKLKIKKNAEIKEISEKKSNLNINKMLKCNENHNLKFTEKININKAKKILSMNDEEIIEKAFDHYEIDHSGKKKSEEEKKVYIKNVKELCKLAVLNKGVVPQLYKYSKSLEENKQGRIYVNKFGVQSLQKKIRGYLSGEYYNDIDMNNAFPTLLCYFMNTYYPSIPIINLKKYVENRDKLLIKYDTSKLDVLCWLHRDFAYKGDNKLITSLDSDFKKIQSTLWNDTENPICNLVDKKSINSTNKKGSLVNRVLGILENDILQGVIKDLKDNVGVPYYDGAFIDKSINTKDLIKTLNKSTEEYGIKWSHKEHSSLDISEDIEFETIHAEPVLEEALYGYEFIEYETLKKKFEKNHAVITAPFIIVREYEDFYSYKNKNKLSLKQELYSVSNIKDLYNNLYYDTKSFQKVGTGKTAEYVEKVIKCKFVERWLEDPTRRTLKKIDFIPHNPNNKKLCPKNIYNLFGGYSAELPKEKEYDYDIDKEVQRFINHLDLLVGHEEDAKNYLINYIADMVQNPENLPAVALVFKSKQGLGKDLLVNYLEKIIGEKYVYRTSNVEEVYGTFNPAVKGKLLVQINELDGKDGFAKKERLKDSITTESLNINEKNIKQFTIMNAIRWIIFSNNMTPIDIPADDRRFVVYQGADLLPEDKRESYYNPLFDNLNNNEVINKIFEYFMNVDLSDFNIRRQRPITSAYKNIRESCIPPMYKFTWDLLNDLFEVGNTGIMKHKKIKKSLIRSVDFHNLYTKWYNKILKSDTVLNFKQLKPMLTNIKIKKNEVSIKGAKDYYYIYDKEEVIKLLKEEHKCGAEAEDILELDDDFEEDGFIDSDSEDDLDSGLN